MECPFRVCGGQNFERRELNFIPISCYECVKCAVRFSDPDKFGLYLEIPEEQSIELNTGGYSERK